MPEGHRIGVCAAVVAVLGVLCCAFPALFVGGVLALAGRRWWLSVGLILLMLGGWFWHRRGK